MHHGRDLAVPKRRDRRRAEIGIRLEQKLDRRPRPGLRLVKETHDLIDARQDLAAAVAGPELEFGHDDSIAVHQAQRPAGPDLRVHRFGRDGKRLRGLGQRETAAGCCEQRGTWRGRHS